MADRNRDARRGDKEGAAASALVPTPRRRPPAVLRHAEGGDTIEAWERFLTGDAPAVMPGGNFVVSSWRRSQAHGIDPTGRAAPLAARGDAVEMLRDRNRMLVEAAQDIFVHTADLLVGARSIMVLTDPDGVVLQVAGDGRTREEGEAIHLTLGGVWREDRIGTNGIGTAIATRRPAQVHAAEHFCEGIKSWTCAACPIFEPGTGDVLGVIDISGPPTTYQRTNLALAVTTARQIETALSERAARERFQLMEACLERLSAQDVGGLVALDRSGRLVHAAGRVQPPARIGERLPGLNGNTAVLDWAKLLPREWRPEWFNPVAVNGETIGAMLVVPDRTGSPRAAPRAPVECGGDRGGSEADPGRASFERIVGQSAAMHATIERARFLVDKQVPVLIEGETGVGKELLARAIHGQGAPTKPFVVLNCGGVTRELVSGELFGHVRGAFTGATSEGRPGRFELAHGGVLCLDEIGEMPLEVQPFLLRALEEGIVYRVGDAQPRRVDVRLVTMTNRNLLEEVKAGRFRRDLYYRISVTKLRIPPLRERDDDVLLLAEHFNGTLSRRHGVPPLRLAPEVRSALLAHDWPGNARELRNLIESLLLMTTAGEIGLEELAPFLAPAGSPAVLAPEAGRPATLESTECAAIRHALVSARGNFVAAACSLGISRSTLYRKAERYGLRV